MMVLSVAAARAHQKPAILFNLPENFPDFHWANSIQAFKAQPAADFHPVIQLLPVNRVTTGFKRPVGSLPGSGLGKPAKPGNFL